MQELKEFVTKSSLNIYYDFHALDISTFFDLVEGHENGENAVFVEFEDITGKLRRYRLTKDQEEAFDVLPDTGKMVCEIGLAEDRLLKLNPDRIRLGEDGRYLFEKKFRTGAFLTKREYMLMAHNIKSNEVSTGGKLYSFLEWKPNEKGRLYNLMKMMEAYDGFAALRIDLFPADETTTSGSWSGKR